MPVETPAAATSPEELIRAHRDSLIPIDEKISYAAIPPMLEEDLRHYIQDTIAALPPATREQLPSLRIYLVPYLETREGKEGVRVSFEPVRLEQTTPAFKLIEKGHVNLLFGTRDEEVSEYHFNFYHQLSEILAAKWGKEVSAAFVGLVKEEMAAKVHGEIDEKSWQMKQALQVRTGSKDSRQFRDYANQAFIDTMTLYLHGICCDIDVETGPRQMPSRWVRKRLEILHGLYPPPAGLAVFPEQVASKSTRFAQSRRQQGG